MANLKQIIDAIETLKSKWDNEGSCKSCGWHALLCEHEVDYRDVGEALDADGVLRLSCLNKDDENRDLHRGIAIHIA